MREKRLYRRNEIIGDCAAQTAVGEFDDIFFRTVLDAAGAQNVAVDADVAEFVDDERKASVAGVFQQITDQRRLAGAEKAGDDGGWYFGRAQSNSSRNTSRQTRPASAPARTHDTACTVSEAAVKRAAISAGTVLSGVAGVGQKKCGATISATPMTFAGAASRRSRA
jgi:hypothetical protein